MFFISEVHKTAFQISLFLSNSSQISHASIIAGSTVEVELEAVAKGDFMRAWHPQSHGIDVVGITYTKVLDFEANGQTDRFLRAIIDAYREQVAVNHLRTHIKLP